MLKRFIFAAMTASTFFVSSFSSAVLPGDEESGLAEPHAQSPSLKTRVGEVLAQLPAQVDQMVHDVQHSMNFHDCLFNHAQDNNKFDVYKKATDSCQNPEVKEKSNQITAIMQAQPKGIIDEGTLPKEVFELMQEIAELNESSASQSNSEVLDVMEAIGKVQTSVIEEARQTTQRLVSDATDVLAKEEMDTLFQRVNEMQLVWSHISHVMNNLGDEWVRLLESRFPNDEEVSSLFGRQFIQNWVSSMLDVSQEPFKVIFGGALMLKAQKGNRASTKSFITDPIPDVKLEATVRIGNFTVKTEGMTLSDWQKADIQTLQFERVDKI